MTCVVLFYQYADIEYPRIISSWIQSICLYQHLTGRVFVAHEGVNGTLAGSSTQIDHFIEMLSNHPSQYFKATDFKLSYLESDTPIFRRLWVKVVKEIIQLGQDTDEISYKQAGNHLSPQRFHDAWKNALITQDCLLIDCRNMYESAVGRFDGAHRIPSRHFREFTDIVDDWIKTTPDIVHKDVFMYCTGGIRCERASSYMSIKGFTNVNQLEGGIHRYCETISECDSLFRGRNFVFDRRIVTDRIGSTPVSDCIVCGIPWDVYTKSQSCQKCKCLIPVCEYCSKKTQQDIVKANMLCELCITRRI